MDSKQQFMFPMKSLPGGKTIYTGIYVFSFLFNPLTSSWFIGIGSFQGRHVTRRLHARRGTSLGGPYTCGFWRGGTRCVFRVGP